MRLWKTLRGVFGHYRWRVLARRGYNPYEVYSVPPRQLVKGFWQQNGAR